MMVVWCRHLYLRCVQLEILFVWCSNCCPHMILVISLWVFVDRGRMLPPDRINLLSVTCLLTIKFMLINQQFQVDRVRMYFLFISFQFDTLCPYCFEFSRCLIWYPCPALFPEDKLWYWCAGLLWLYLLQGLFFQNTEYDLTMTSWFHGLLQVNSHSPAIW